jgi:hypothetical protein
MKKLTIEQAKKISPRVLLKIIQRAKDYIKKTDVYKDMCKKCDVDIDVIDLVPVKFGDLDVSARTERGIITLNWKLLCNGNFFNNYHYLVHECDHYYRQCYGERPSKGADDGSYLDNPDEQAAFQKQIRYIDDEFGEDEAEDYVEHLLNHHDVKNSKEREDKKEKLMKDVDD